MGNKTTTTELIERVAQDTAMSKVDVKRILGALTSGIGDDLAAGHEVTISGFGTFKPRQNAARKGRNPRTGEEVDIAASTSAAFKQAKALKDALN